MLKLKHVLAATIILYSASAFAQIKKADSLYKAKKYDKAGPIYVSVAEHDEFKVSKHNDYYNAACCYALSGKADSAFTLLKLCLQNGNMGSSEFDHLKVDSDLMSLHPLSQWTTLVNSIKPKITSTNDPNNAKLITTDVKNFWKAYDMAQKDTAHRRDIYKKYYVDAGTPGLQDYMAIKVRSMKSFVRHHDKEPKFYAAVRKNTLMVDAQKPQMMASFVKLKQLYPEAGFPDVYFVIGAFTSAGTSTDNGLLIGVDQIARTPDIPTDEMSLWERNNFTDMNKLPNIIAHELIHFNQRGMADDSTLLQAVMIEGSADFIGELISGKTANERLHVWAKGKEKKVWADFEKEMYTSHVYNWIANSNQETADKPADLGYWVGYQICKAYYDKSPDKQKAVHDILNIKNYKEFYEKSGVAKLYAN